MDKNLEQARQERNDLIRKIEAFKKNGNENRTPEERKERNKNFSKMVDELADAQKLVKQLEVIEDAKQNKEREEEFSVRKIPNNGGGDLKLRRASWDDPVTDESRTPKLEELEQRDVLVFERFNDPEALTTEQMVKAHRMYAGERLFFKYIAAGASNEKLRLSQAEMDLFHEHQERAQATTAQIAADGDGGYLVPTVTEAAIVHQMAFIGPFAGPGGGAGMWRMYPNGEPHKINVNTSRKNAKAVYVSEATDIGAQKAAWSQVNLNFHTIANLMPWTIQVQQDSASNLEQELRMEMAESFGRLLNDELTASGKGDNDNHRLNSLAGSILANQTVTGANAYDTNENGGNSSYDLANSNILPREVITAKYLIDKAYRGTPDFLMHCSDYAMMTFEQLVDKDGRFLYHRETDGPAMIIHGLRCITNNGFIHPSGAADAVTRNQFHSIIGAFNKFRVGYVRGMYVTVFRELFMQSLQLGLMAYWRVGSVQTDANAFSGLRFPRT